MPRIVLRAAIAALLVMAGWAAGRAQATEPAFELVVNAPAGETRIECVRGCDLAWVERGLNPQAMPARTFTFRCTGRAVPARCSSARVGGWLR